MEAIWWIFTAIVAVAVLYPIYQVMDHYPFWLTNSVFIVVFITFSRHIFLLKYSLLAGSDPVKIAIVLIALPFIFFLIHRLNYFQAYIDETGLEALLSNVSGHHHHSLKEYIQNEMMFFGTASIISAIILPFRLVAHIWQRHNRQA